MMKKIFLLLLIPVLFSCGKTPIQVENDGCTAIDSTLLCRQDSVVRILIGDRLIPMPLASQFVEGDGENFYYILLDENTLYCFDATTGKLLKTEELKECGTLNNYSGFLYRNDTVFLYNYKQKMVYMLDSLRIVKKQWNVVNNNIQKGDLDPEALTDSPILYSQGTILLSGVKLGQLNKDGDKPPISCAIDISRDEIVYGGEYPCQYFEGDFGGVYFNTIYHTLDESGNWLYSFPADHYVYSYSQDFSICEKMYMGSRYTPMITTSDYNSLELIRDKDLRIKYFVGQHSYSNLLYDKYRNVYYRIAQHPLIGWESGAFSKPFSIIVMDVNGTLISETPIQEDYANLNLHNMHVTRKGLLIQRETADENVIEFIIYKLINDER